MRAVWNSTRYRPDNDPKSIYSGGVGKEESKFELCTTVEIVQMSSLSYLHEIHPITGIYRVFTDTNTSFFPLQLERAADLSVPEKVLRLFVLSLNNLCFFNLFCGRIHPKIPVVVVAVILVFPPICGR